MRRQQMEKPRPLCGDLSVAIDQWKSSASSSTYLFAPVTRTVKVDFSSALRGEASILRCGDYQIESTVRLGGKVSCEALNALRNPV